jgi:hypothetical protein
MGKSVAFTLCKYSDSMGVRVLLIDQTVVDLSNANTSLSGEFGVLSLCIVTFSS